MLLEPGVEVKFSVWSNVIEHEFGIMLQNRAAVLINRIKGDGLEARVLRDSGSSFIVKTSGMGLSLLSQLVLARFLGLEEFGTYIYVITWMLIISLIGKVGFGHAAIRYVADYKANEDWGLLRGYILRASQLVIGLSLLSIVIYSFVVGLLSSEGIIDQELTSVLWYASPLLLFLALLDLHSGILRGLDRLVHALTLELIIYPLSVTVAIIACTLLLPFSIGASGAIAINVLVLLMVIVIQGFIIQRGLPKASSNKNTRFMTREWMRTSFSIWTSLAIQNLIKRLDVIVVGTFIGPSEAGIYSIAARLILIVELGLQVTNLASAHRFAPLQSLGMKKELQQIVFLTTKMAFLSTIPLALFLILGAEKVLLLFGQDFIGGIPILQILIFGEMINVLTGPNALLLNMTGYHNDMAWIFLSSLVVDIMLMLVLFYPLGIVGIAIASALTTAYRNLVTVIRVRQCLGINSTIFSTKAWVSN